MQYHQYRAAGWPIGSGTVESGNKVMMQARMKGPGMHWAPEHVNPLLALRSGACSNRWEQTEQQAHLHHQQQRVAARDQRRLHRYEQHLTCLLVLMLRWRSEKPKVPPASPLQTPAVDPPKGPHKPAANHPWRKPFLAKK
jgi:hypothetical protein